MGIDRKVTLFYSPQTRATGTLNLLEELGADYELHVVDTLHQRKALMASLADGFAALPGGVGTLDELFEALTLVQTGKVTSFPIVLVGTAYWAGLVDWMRDSVLATGKIGQTDLDRLIVTDDLDEAVSIMVAAREEHAR